jgi:hypothetical protein
VSITPTALSRKATVGKLKRCSSVDKSLVLGKKAYVSTYYVLFKPFLPNIRHFVISSLFGSQSFGSHML